MKKICLLLLPLFSVVSMSAERDDRVLRKRRRRLVSRINKHQARGKKTDLKKESKASSLVVKHAPLIASGAGKTLQIRGSIRMKDNHGKLPHFRVLFDGQETMSNNEGFFSLPTDMTSLDEYSLVMTKKIVKEFDRKNTLKCLKVIPDMPYQYFTFTRNIASGQWQMTEKRLFNNNFVIPDHAVVVLLNPQKYVDYIEPWDISLPEDSLKMPLIMLKADIPIDQVKRHSAKSLLYSLDEGVFHQQVTQVRKSQQADGKVQISRAG